MRLPSTIGFAVSGVTVAALALSGCSANSGDSAEATDATVQIVASTNVYGDIAATLGGELVSVTSLIDSSAQDPHSYEASAQDQLALSKADLVIENGGGYDDFIDTLLSASDNSDVTLVTAADASGLLEDADHDEDADAATDDDGHTHIEGFNEHVWYSFHGVEHIAEEITSQLSELDADNAAVYEANYDAFAAQLATLEEKAEALQATTAGLGVAITEPVPLYLLTEAGLTNKTPDEFSEAIEEGTDVSPTVLQDTLALFSNNDVALLAYNEQTAGAETEQVLDAATDAGIPVLSFTETLPDGADYISWMTDNLDAITAAVQ